MINSGYKREKSSRPNLFITALYRLEDCILVVLLALMMGVAVVQILLRNFSGTGIIWGDVLVRITVLWLGLFGAMIAARQDKHISIDLVMRYLPERLGMCVNAIVRLFAAVVCIWAAYYSFIFVLAEYAEGGLAFGQVPVWVCEAVIPLAFTVMALRYLAMSVRQSRTVFAAKRITK